MRGEGVWLFDNDGRRYLDCYNNVPSVGHCHPRVVEAIATQAGRLNTHTRYLHETVVKLAERLGTKLSKGLSACWFVCSGTEANDLATQIARAVTGHYGMLVCEGAYHGNSDLVLKLSTDSYPPEDRPDWLAVAEAPNTYRGPFRAGEEGRTDADLAACYAESAAEAIAPKVPPQPTSNSSPRSGPCTSASGISLAIACTFARRSSCMRWLFRGS